MGLRSSYSRDYINLWSFYKLSVLTHKIKRVYAVKNQYLKTINDRHTGLAKYTNTTVIQHFNFIIEQNSKSQKESVIVHFTK